MAKILKTIRYIIANLSLKIEIILLYFIMSAALFCSVIFCVNAYIIKPLKQDYKNSLYSTSQNFANQVTQTREKYEFLLMQLSYSPNLAYTLSRNYSDYESIWAAYNTLHNTYDVFRDCLPGTKFFRIYHNAATFGEDESLIFKIPKSGEASGNYQPVSSNKQYEWRRIYDDTIQEYVLTLKRNVNCYYSNMKAFFLIGIDSQYTFGHMLDSHNSSINSYYIYDKSNTVLASSKDSAVGNKLATVPLSRFYVSFNQVCEYNTVNGDIYVTKIKIENDWTMLISLSMKAYDSKVRYFTGSIILFISILSLLFSIMIVFFINSIFSRLGKLAHQMRILSSTNADDISISTHHDEIAELEKEYNDMLLKLRKIATQMSEAKVREREQALKVLEYQINPHFLYNTLGVIRWEAIGCSNDTICNLIDNMTTFYRLSLNRGSTILTVEKEIEHIKAYISIQQIRYRNMVEVCYDFDERAFPFYTLKMTLQPLVENSYLHGRITAGQHNKLFVSVHLVDDNIVFTVCDNGVGMDESTLENVRNKRSQESGIGLNYIRESLALYFGDRASLLLESELNVGTKAMIMIPAITQPPKLKED